MATYSWPCSTSMTSSLFPTHHNPQTLSFFIGRGYVGGMRKTFLTLLILFIYTPQAHAADVLWKAGAAAIKITPQKPVLMSGYASRTKPFDRVELDLYAKALALDDGANHRAIILTMDLIGLSSKIAEPVAQRIGEKTNLKREQILLNFAHNHAGPVL